MCYTFDTLLDLFIFFTFLSLHIYIYVGVYVCGWVHIPGHIFFHYMKSGDRTLVVRLACKHFDPLSHPDSLITLYFKRFLHLCLCRISLKCLWECRKWSHMELVLWKVLNYKFIFFNGYIFFQTVFFQVTLLFCVLQEIFSKLLFYWHNCSYSLSIYRIMNVIFLVPNIHNCALSYLSLSLSFWDRVSFYGPG